jgi:starch-binding outer membrane protein, SusD/RagB family
MKKIRMKYIIGLLAVLLSSTACENFLVQEPVLEQTNELTLSTFKGLNSATAGTYSLLYGTTWYGRNFVVTADLKGGNAKLSPKSSGRFTTEYQWNNNAGSAPGLWGTAYATIARANNVINALADFDDPLVAQEDLDHLQAECLFLRGLAYFDLVREYAQPYTYQKESLGVPIVLVTEEGYPARNTVAEVYAQVVSDLTDAERLIGSYVREGSKDPLGVASKGAVQALLSRVYLYMGDWQKAADYATTIINSGNYTMYTAADYTTWDNGGVWGLEAGRGEMVFEVYGAEGNSAHGNWDVISYILSPDGYGDVGASKDLTSLYEEGDVRRNLFTTAADYGDAEWSLKYPGKGGNLREDNIPVLRLSEMYLIRAESIINGATISGASPLSDYNMIRTHRGLAAATNVSLSDIYDERRRELCFEGQAVFDLARTQRDLVRVDYDGSVNQDVAFPDYKWAMPIPQSEVDANENMVQNEGY